MPCTPDAVRVLQAAEVLFGPARPPTPRRRYRGWRWRNAMRLSWLRTEVERRLRDTMRNIHDTCVQHGESGGSVDYVRGANLAGLVARRTPCSRKGHIAVDQLHLVAVLATRRHKTGPISGLCRPVGLPLASLWQATHSGGLANLTGEVQ